MNIFKKYSGLVSILLTLSGCIKQQESNPSLDLKIISESKTHVQLYFEDKGRKFEFFDEGLYGPEGYLDRFTYTNQDTTYILNRNSNQEEFLKWKIFYLSVIYPEYRKLKSYPNT